MTGQPPSEFPAPRAVGQRPRLRRRWRWLVLLPLLALPWWGPNVPWVKARIERRLSARTGLECRLGTILPVSWDGRAHLHGLSLSRPGAPTPLVELPHLSAIVRWQAMMGGRLEITSLAVHGGWLHWTPPPPAPTPESMHETGAETPETQDPHSDDLATRDATDPPTPGPGGERPAGLLGSAETRVSSSVAAEGESPAPTSSPASESPAATPPVAPVASSEPAVPPADQPAPGTPTASAPLPGSPAPRESRWRIDRLELRDIRLRWKRAAHTPGADWLAGTLNLDSPFDPEATTAARPGNVSLTDLQIAGRAWPEDINVPLTWDGIALRVRQAAVPVPGGTAHLSWEFTPASPGQPLIGSVACAGLDIRDLAAWLLPGAAPADGRADGEWHFALPARRPGRLRTVGQFRLTGLTLPITAWLRHAEMTGLADRWPVPQWPARGASAQFHSSGGQFTLQDATLSADDLTVRALGTATAAGPSLAVRAYVQPGGADLLSRLSAPWPPDRQLQPQPLPNSPWAYVDLGIQGPWSLPEIVLWDRAWPLPDLRSEIRRLQGPPPPS